MERVFAPGHPSILSLCRTLSHSLTHSPPRTRAHATTRPTAAAPLLLKPQSHERNGEGKGRDASGEQEESLLPPDLNMDPDEAVSGGKQDEKREGKGEEKGFNDDERKGELHE